MTSARLSATRALPADPTNRPRLGWSAIGPALVFWLVAAANAAVIVVLWWRGGNVTGLHHLGDVLTSVGRLTGLLGAYTALLQVLLLARIPWIERPAGFDRLTIWHRLNGKACLLLVLAHVVLTTAGYTLMDRISLPREVKTLVLTYPGMIAATVGTALMIAVVASSLVIVRRRLRYESWYLVHLTAYASIALAWFHQIPTGNEFITNSAATQYWTSLYVVALALLIVFRVMQPLVQAVRRDLRVAAVTPEGPGVVSVTITGRHMEDGSVRPGQFFQWRFLTRDRWWEAHPFSLSKAPSGGQFRITVKDSGDFSRRMAGIKPGTRVIAEGPFGIFTSAVRRTERAVLIAGGIGITPIRALLEEMDGDVVLLYRAMRQEDVIFRQEITRLAAERSITVRYIIGDHRTIEGRDLLSRQHLLDLVPDIDRRDVYICGPPGLVDALLVNVRATGVPRRNIHVERFAL